MDERDKRQGDAPIRVSDRRRFDDRGDLVQGREPEAAEEEETAMEVVPQTIPIEELHAAEDRARAAEQRYARLVDDYKRFREEHEAVRARLERDIDARVRTRLGDALATLLDPLDNLDRALEFADEGPLTEGVRLVRQQILDGLAQAGLTRIDLEGQPFDPSLAEAIAMVPVDDEAQHGIVLEQVRCGYRVDDRVLRPAQVRVGANEGDAGTS